MIPLRALLVDLAAGRAELRRLLAAHADVQIAAEAGSFAEAWSRLDEGAIDVIFLALTLPGGDALALLRCVPNGTRVILMTAPDRPLVRALRAGPANHLPKPLAADAVAAALAHVRQNRGIRPSDTPGGAAAAT